MFSAWIPANTASSVPDRFVEKKLSKLWFW
ncbi:hypothetical protein MED222_05715 [Vibrio sp. MED222]|nr:hypothetical protein MED222_05715 [Vibrio sp. MED222]